MSISLWMLHECLLESSLPVDYYEQIWFVSYFIEMSTSYLSKHSLLSILFCLCFYLVIVSVSVSVVKLTCDVTKLACQW